MIKVTDLYKRYGKVEALKGVSFEVNKGEILGFLGPNGAGKTTTMKILTGFFPPSSGRVEIAGMRLEKNLIEIKKRIGYLPENVPLYADMRVIDFLMFVARIKGVSPKKRRAQVDTTLEECGVTSVRTRYIRTLSKGYRQRVGLAQSLIGDPDILILDEPTIGLDPKQIIDIRLLIKKMARTKTIICCTHILPEVSMIADRVIILNEGQIVAIDTPDNLHSGLESSSHVSVTVKGDEQAVIQCLQALSAVQQVQVAKRLPTAVIYTVMSEKNTDIRGEIAAAILGSAQQLTLLELKAQSMSLEDIFLKLVTQESGVS